MVCFRLDIVISCSPLPFRFYFSHLGHDFTLFHFIFILRDCFILIGFMEEEVNILCIITHVHMCITKYKITLLLYFEVLMCMFYQHLGFGILDTKIKDKYKIVCNVYVSPALVTKRN